MKKTFIFYISLYFRHAIVFCNLIAGNGTFKVKFEECFPKKLKIDDGGCIFLHLIN